MNNDIKVDATLSHFGVKGMKWGHRKAQDKSYETNDRRVISKGTSLQNISEGKGRTLDHLVYASYTPKDNANYKSFYAGLMDKPFDNKWEVKREIVVPSQKKAISKLKELIVEDPKGMYTALGKAKVEASAFRTLGAKLGLPLESKYSKQYSKMGKDLVAEKSFQSFMDSVPSMTPKHKTYIDSLVKEGFSGMVDYHDTKKFGSEDPLIIFKGSSNINVSSPAKRLSERDIDRAFDKYYELEKAEVNNE